MLNHSDQPKPPPAQESTATPRPSLGTPVFSDPFNSDWCLGSEPVRWDVPFTVRLMKELKRFFRRREFVERQGASAAVSPSTEPHVTIRLGPAVTERVRQAA